MINQLKREKWKIEINWIWKPFYFTKSTLIFILVRVGISNNPPQQSNYRKHSSKRFQLTIICTIHVIKQCRFVTNVVYHITHQVNFFISINYISTQSSIKLRSCKVVITLLMMLLAFLAHLCVLNIKVHFCFDINNEYIAPSALNKERILMHWS